MCIKIYYLAHNKIGDIMNYIILIIKIIFFYFFIAATYRVMGKREVGQLGVMDLIVSILIAELAALSIGSMDLPLLYSIIPICILVLFQVSIGYLSLKKPFIRYLLDGKPSVIINKGKLNFKEMVKQKYNLDDLLLQLREKSIKNIENVEYAILESNGRLSTFTYPDYIEQDEFPMPLILDGSIQYNTLKLMKKDETWLYKILKQKDVSLENVFYAFYRKDKTFIIKRDSNN